MASAAKTYRVLLICLLACAPPVLAQSTDIEQTDIKRTRRELEMDQAIQDAAEESEALAPLRTKDEVTYQQVLADPDNLDLNFRYAKSQVARGELTGASATLERILMINPDLSAIRLFYALVLFRLDNLDDAERELGTVLEAKDLPDGERSRVQQTLRAIRRKRVRTAWTVTTTIGWGADSNRNAAPSAKERMVFDIVLPVSGTSRPRRDTHALYVQNLSVAHTLGAQAGHQLIGSIDYFLGEQTTVDDLDIASFGVEGGGVIKLPRFTVTPTAHVGNLELSRESYLRSHGTNLRVDVPLGDRASAALEHRWTREDFLGISENLAAPERTGDRHNVLLAWKYLWRPTVQLGLEAGYENKDIRGSADYNGYEGGSLTASHTWLLGRGQFLLSSLTYTRNVYDEPDTAVSLRTRRENQLRARVAYGVPVELLIGAWTPEALVADTTAIVSFEQLRSLSNITNYQYKNSKIDLLLTRRFEF